MPLGRKILYVVLALALPACGEVLGAEFADKFDDCTTEGELRCADGLVCHGGKWVTDPGTRTCQGQEAVQCQHGVLRVLETCKAPCLGAGECRHVVKVDVSLQNACALLDDGTLWCWGEAYLGALGRDPAIVSTSTPLPVPNLSGIVDFGLGERFGCALRDTGRVACWGANTAGQLGSEAGQWHAEAIDVGGLENVVELFVTTETVCAREGNGSFACWGRAHYPCMPDADHGWAAYHPAPLPELSTASALISPMGMVCGTLPPYGSLYCCDDPFDLSSNYPKNGEVSDVTLAAAGERHLCVLRSDGNLSCWGRNEGGQLCNGKAAMGMLDEGTLEVGPLAHLAAGVANTYLVEPNGDLRCCGTNKNSECGVPSVLAPEVTEPIRVLSNVSWVGGGRKFACALTFDHEVMCWGENSTGVTGTDGFLEASPTPVVWQR